jgi:hypothetical protein
MNRRLDELLIERGRLLERVTTQRYFLRQELIPVCQALGAVDRGIAKANSIGRYIKSHPSLAILALAALFFMKSRRPLQWAKRGFFVWQSWRALRDRLAMFGARVRS